LFIELLSDCSNAGKEEFVSAEVRRPSGAKKRVGTMKPPLTAEVQTMISRLQTDWFGLHYLDRARRIAAIRRAKAAIRQREAQLQVAFERQCIEAAREESVVICKWLCDTGFSGPTCEQIVEEVRREFGQRERDGSLPAHPLQKIFLSGN